MGKKSGLVETTVEETTPSAKVSVEETPVAEAPKKQTTATGYPSRDFKNRFING